MLVRRQGLRTDRLELLSGRVDGDESGFAGHVSNQCAPESPDGAEGGSTDAREVPGGENARSRIRRTQPEAYVLNQERSVEELMEIPSSR